MNDSVVEQSAFIALLWWAFEKNAAIKASASEKLRKQKPSRQTLFQRERKKEQRGEACPYNEKQWRD